MIGPATGENERGLEVWSVDKNKKRTIVHLVQICRSTWNKGIYLKLIIQSFNESYSEKHKQSPKCKKEAFLKSSERSQEDLWTL